MSRKSSIRALAVLTFSLSIPISHADGFPRRGTNNRLPWEVWEDPRELPRLLTGHQVLLRSSHCPDGCRFDRHSAGDSRFIRLEGDEGVIFEEAGPGAITRIWMTMGAGGVSQPLDPDIRIRIYLDGEATPGVDLPLPEFYAGVQAPFLPPLVGDRLTSSGGNFSYVPIPYRKSCKVTLVGAEEARIWFQVTYHRLADATGVTTFTGEEDLSRWIELLGAPGEDPWPEDDPAEIAAGQIDLAGGESTAFFTAEDGGLITGLRLEAPEPSWDSLRLILSFDGRTTVDLALRDAFAMGRGGPLPTRPLPTRSLLFGLDAEQRLYLYYPMPYFEGMEARLVNTASGGEPITAGFWVRRSALQPLAGSGFFSTQLRSADPSVPGSDLPLLEIGGAGKWVGLFADLGSVETTSRQYLEGDERIYLDGSRHPGIYGTGTEDLFAGGFYFDQDEFRTALHGMTYQFLASGESVTAAYRLFLTDAISFGAAIRAGLETGPTGEMPMRARSVSYFYHRRDRVLARRDVLDLSDPSSIANHQFSVTGLSTPVSLTASFEGEPPLELETSGIHRQQGEASFVVATSGCLGTFRLRRLLDAKYAGQAAVVLVDGTEAALLPPIDPNQDRRWREVDVDLAASPSGETATITIAYDSGDLPPPMVGEVMTEFRYELWCAMNSLLFEDGFESGDVARWSAAVGAPGAP